MGGNLSSVVDVTRQRCDQSTAVNSGPMPFKVGSIAGAGVAGSLDSLDLLEQQLQPIGSSRSVPSNVLATDGH
ncbi:hypothetical protein RGR602_PC02355 (plasmid) [Rhizobium gallicum bv. gallicum R602sp]|uniref:Uncharacterized protein n=1 Tax=Rhizobium gallicum bv. gallicum R602sp TaxID=1041138 RepID=A0A0B4XEB7_9HYPH|nr:hypothetical protein RGR602_PC02355 [Rhizobium gallicum bv. gallicum R602sp]